MGIRKGAGKVEQHVHLALADPLQAPSASSFPSPHLPMPTCGSSKPTPSLPGPSLPLPLPTPPLPPSHFSTRTSLFPTRSEPARSTRWMHDEQGWLSELVKLRRTDSTAWLRLLWALSAVEAVDRFLEPSLNTWHTHKM